MRHFSRSYIAAFLFAASLATAGTAVLTGPTADQKRDLVHQALEKQGSAADDPVLMQAAERAQVLTAIEVVEGETPSIVVKTTGRPPFEYLSLDEGRKLAIDFHDTLNGIAAVPEVPKGSTLKAMRTSLFALEPQFVSRVVLELTRPCEPRFVVEDGSVRVELAPAIASKPGTTSAVVRQLVAKAEQHERQAAVQHSALMEGLARASHGDTDRVNELETALKAAGEALQQAKAGLLATDLEAAVPRDVVKPVVQTDEAAKSLEAKAAALRQDRQEAESLIARHEKEVRERVNACQEYLARIHERSSYDRDALKDLDTRLASGAIAEDGARKSLALLEQKMTRAQDEEMESLRQLGAALDSGVTAYAQELDRFAQRLADRNAELSQILVAQPIASHSAPVDDSAILLAQLDEEVSKVKAASSPTASSQAKAAPQALDAVSDPQVDLSTDSVSPSATLAHLTTVPSLLFAQDEGDSPVADAAAEDAGAEPTEAAPAEESAPAAEPPADAPASPAAEAPAAPETPIAEEPVVPEQPEPKSVVIAAPTPAAEELEEVSGSPDALNEPVNLDLREMDLSNFVALLARKAGINVIAGTELTGTVTASIKNVPLRQALEMVLRMHDLGVVEEEGVFRIVPYATAQIAERDTRMITLQNGNVEDVKMTLDSVVMNSPSAKAISIAANPSTNVLVISGPVERVEELATLATALDVAKPATPTVTKAIKLNYAEPEEVDTIIKSMLTQETGQAAVDLRGRQIVVTDVPAVVEQVSALVADIDIPVKQVAVEAMVVNAILSDASQTGTEWLLNVVRRRNTRGETVGNLQDADFGANLGNIGTSALDAGLLSFNVLSSDIDLEATIAAEATSRNAEILANPQLVIVENETGEISIVQDFPYQEITQTTQGPPVATTNFKPIGVTMQVTPRVTHTNEIIAEIQAKQSSVSGLTDTGVPIEDKREAGTTLNIKDGQTIFIGGLRNRADRLEVNKVPVLGDIPVFNFLFRSTQTEKTNTDLMIFLTCHVLGQHLPDLSPAEQEAYDKLGNTPTVPDSQRAMFRSYVKPGEMRDPAWKWRRSK